LGRTPNSAPRKSGLGKRKGSPPVTIYDSRTRNQLWIKYQEIESQGVARKREGEIKSFSYNRSGVVRSKSDLGLIVKQGFKKGGLRGVSMDTYDDGGKGKKVGGFGVKLLLT